LDEVPSYKHLGIDIHHKLNWNYRGEKNDKCLKRGGKIIMGLKTIVNQWTFRFGIRKNASLTL
jgi:hypothetical protein